MKVICVKQDSLVVQGEGGVGLLQEGSAYTVTDVEACPNGTYYRLEQFDPFDYFWDGLFIPISDIDETELIKERQEYETAF